MLASRHHRIPPVLRGAALMPAAALLVHQLRYELAFGADAPRALARQGHAYLSSLAPWIVLLAALALGASLGALVQRWGSGDAAGRPMGSRRATGLRTWLLASTALAAVYAGQELLEGCFAGGHAGGVAAVVGGGGWWALPVALLVGGLLALALRAGTAAEEALERLAPLRLPLRALASPDALPLWPDAPALRALAPLARAGAGRAPPRRAIAPTPA
jgi:hypothetical protein